MEIEFITAPLIGGVIGLITNSLAIKMLFRPYKEIRIGRMRLPFTPGLIPKEKPRIAHAIANVISEYILDNETILAALASSTIQEAYEKKYQEYVDFLKKTDMTCEELLEKFKLADSANIVETKFRNSAGAYLVEVVQRENLARSVINYAFLEMKKNLNPLLYKVSRGALESTRESLIEYVNEMLVRQGPEIIGTYIDSVYIEWLDKPVCEIVNLLEQKFPDLKQIIWDKYTKFIREKSDQFLGTLNLPGIIEKKINDYDLEELERMIMEISKKELNALVWLGGLLGILMGLLNLLF